VEVHHEQGGAVGPDGEETGVAKRYLAGVTHEDVQADREDHVDQDDVQEVDVVGR